MAALRSRGKAGPSTEGGPSRYQSPCLKQLFERLSSGGRQMVLDLGPAVGDNVSFFAAHSCKLHIADLYESLFAPTVRQPESARAFRELLANDLPETGDQTVDVILAWDLLNYLKGDQLKALAEALSATATRARNCSR